MTPLHGCSNASPVTQLCRPAILTFLATIISPVLHCGLSQSKLPCPPNRLCLPSCEYRLCAPKSASAMQVFAHLAKAVFINAPTVASFPTLQAVRAAIPMAAQAAAAGMGQLPAASNGTTFAFVRAMQHTQRVSSAAMSAFADPTRDDKVAELGELTGTSRSNLLSVTSASCVPLPAPFAKHPCQQTYPVILIAIFLQANLP